MAKNDAKLNEKILKQLDSNMSKMLKYHALYLKYKTKMESIALAVQAGFNSPKQYYAHVAKLNKKAAKLKENNSKLKFWSKSKVKLPDTKELADQLLKEGFSDQVDAEFLRKKTLEILELQRSLKYYADLKPNQIVK